MTSKFAVFDIDNTVVSNFCFGVEYIREAVNQTGNKTDKSTINKAVKFWQDSNASQQQKIFDEQIRPFYHTALIGQPLSILTTLGLQISENSKQYLNPEVLKRLTTHRSQKAHLIAISNSPEISLIGLLKHLDFDLWWAPVMRFDSNNIYLPKLKPEIWDKTVHLKNIVKDNNLTYDDSYAYGDSLSDLGVMEIVTNPIAVTPAEPLRKIALERNWEIINAR